MEKIIILKQWFADNKDINNVITVTIKRETEKAYQVFINDLSVIEWIPKSVIEKIVEKDEVMNIIRNLGEKKANKVLTYIATHKHLFDFNANKEEQMIRAMKRVNVI
jgi:hypothetical protein